MFTSKALCDVCGSGPFTLAYDHPPDGSVVFEVKAARTRQTTETVYVWVCPACSQSFLEVFARMIPRDIGIEKVREAMKTGVWWPPKETLTPVYKK